MTRTWFLFSRRPLSNRHQYHRPRRLHHKLRLLRPMAARNRYRYLQYDSYDSLTQVRNWTNVDGESRQQTHFFHFFHCDQIGITREMTDKDGNLVWFGNYTDWGRLKKDGRAYWNAHQPFRLQNQYFDDQVLTMLAAYMINERINYEYRIAY